MKPIVLVVMLLVGSVAIASDAGWPTKGDKVYIAASFKGLHPPSPVAGAQIKVDMPACTEVEIVKANAQKNQWTMRDPLGGSEHLEGTWLPRMHKTKAECESQLSTEGEPTVGTSGSTFTIKPTASK